MRVKVTYKAVFLFVVALVIASIMAAPAVAGEANGTPEQFPSSSCANGEGKCASPTPPDIGSGNSGGGGHHKGDNGGHHNDGAPTAAGEANGTLEQAPSSSCADLKCLPPPCPDWKCSPPTPPNNPPCPDWKCSLPTPPNNGGGHHQGGNGGGGNGGGNGGHHNGGGQITSTGGQAVGVTHQTIGGANASTIETSPSVVTSTSPVSNEIQASATVPSGSNAAEQAVAVLSTSNAEQASAAPSESSEEQASAAPSGGAGGAVEEEASETSSGSGKTPAMLPETGGISPVTLLATLLLTAASIVGTLGLVVWIWTFSAKAQG